MKKIVKRLFTSERPYRSDMAWVEEISTHRAAGEADSIRDGEFHYARYKFIRWCADSSANTAEELLEELEAENASRKSFEAENASIFEARKAAMMEVIENSPLAGLVEYRQSGAFCKLNYSPRVVRAATKEWFKIIDAAEAAGRSVD